jgi:hypothetical protein
MSAPEQMNALLLDAKSEAAALRIKVGIHRARLPRASLGQGRLRREGRRPRPPEDLRAAAEGAPAVTVHRCPWCRAIRYSKAAFAVHLRVCKAREVRPR